MIRLGYMQVHKLGCVICVGVGLGVGLELRLWLGLGLALATAWHNDTEASLRRGSGCCLWVGKVRGKQKKWNCQHQQHKQQQFRQQQQHGSKCIAVVWGRCHVASLGQQQQRICCQDVVSRSIWENVAGSPNHNTCKSFVVLLFFSLLSALHSSDSVFSSFVFCLLSLFLVLVYCCPALIN